MDFCCTHLLHVPHAKNLQHSFHLWLLCQTNMLWINAEICLLIFWGKVFTCLTYPDTWLNHLEAGHLGLEFLSLQFKGALHNSLTSLTNLGIWPCPRSSNTIVCPCFPFAFCCGICNASHPPRSTEYGLKKKKKHIYLHSMQIQPENSTCYFFILVFIISLIQW